ncbi:Cell division protein FtsL, partial [Dysosmobacter welbionis]
HPQREHSHHRGRGQDGAGPAPPDPGPHRPQRPAGLCLSHLPPGQDPPGDRRQAAGRHPGVCGVRLRLQDRHAGSGDPGRGEPAGAGAVWVSHERRLRPVPEAAGGGRPGGAWRGEADRDGVCRRPDGERPYPGPVRPLGRTADGPVPPHRRHPHGRGRLGSAGRDAGPLRRGAQVRSGPAGRGPAAFCRG